MVHALPVAEALRLRANELGSAEQRGDARHRAGGLADGALHAVVQRGAGEPVARVAQRVVRVGGGQVGEVALHEVQQGWPGLW